MEVETGIMQWQAWDIWNYHKWEEARKDPPLEPFEGAQPCPHPDLGLLASRTIIA